MICVSVGERRRCVIRIYIILMVEMFYSFESCFTLFDLPLYSFTSVGVNRSVYVTSVSVSPWKAPLLLFCLGGSSLWNICICVPLKGPSFALVDHCYVLQGILVFHLPCAFHLGACLTIIGFWRVWPSQLCFLLLIWQSRESCPALHHTSSLVSLKETTSFLQHVLS